MNSKLKILLVIASIVLAVLSINNPFVNQKNASSTFSKNPDSCCQQIPDCCIDTNSDMVKCNYCNIDEKQSNLARPLKFNLPTGKPLNLTTAKGLQNKAPNYSYNDAFFIQQKEFNKNHQLERHQSYPYLENIHTILLLI